MCITLFDTMFKHPFQGRTLTFYLPYFRRDLIREPFFSENTLVFQNDLTVA